MELLKMLNLFVRFMLELCILVVFSFWGFKTGTQGLMKVVLGVGSPVLLAVIWGTLLAPKAVARLPEPWLSMLELVIFGLATWALHSTGKASLSIALGSIYVVNKILMIVWKQ